MLCRISEDFSEKNAVVLTGESNQMNFWWFHEDFLKIHREMFGRTAVILGWNAGENPRKNSRGTQWLNTGWIWVILLKVLSRFSRMIPRYFFGTIIWDNRGWNDVEILVGFLG